MATTVQDEESRAEPVVEPGSAVISPASLAAKGSTLLETAGDMHRFFIETLRAMPALRRYLPEVLRQAAVLVTSSAAVIWLLQALTGFICGLEADYALRQIGAAGYGGVFGEFCVVREITVFLYAYMLAAKVGCGLVAEIGSMRISDEIDALEVMGVRPMAYIVAVRVAAGWIAAPFIFLVGMVFAYMASKFVMVDMLGDVSGGGYDILFWSFATPWDLTGMMAKMMVITTIVIFVGCYYGFKASGGPVGVGWNTAKSMMVNLVFLHVASAVMSQIFWGSDANVPIAN